MWDWKTGREMEGIVECLGPEERLVLFLRALFMVRDI